MSIASEITRLQGAKADIKTAIEGKGVTVPSNALLDDYNTYINAIITGTVTGLVYESGTKTITSDAARLEINFANAHSVPPVFLVFYDVTGTDYPSNNTNVGMIWVDPWRLWGEPYMYNSSTSSMRYCSVVYTYRASQATSLTTSSTHFSNNSDTTTAPSNTYPRYWVSNTSFYPYTNSSSRYWRKDRTYKWIAVWK